MWDCSAEVWLNRLEAGVALEINRTSLTGAVPFTPNETGLYHITASAGALAWDGGYVPLTLSVDGAGSDPIVLFNWTEANNAPPYHTGRTTLRALASSTPSITTCAVSRPPQTGRAFGVPRSFSWCHPSV